MNKEQIAKAIKITRKGRTGGQVLLPAELRRKKNNKYDWITSIHTMGGKDYLKESEYRLYEMEQQAGSSPCRSCADHIFSLGHNRRRLELTGNYICCSLICQ